MKSIAYNVRLNNKLIDTVFTTDTMCPAPPCQPLACLRHLQSSTVVDALPLSPLGLHGSRLRSRSRYWLGRVTDSFRPNSHFRQDTFDSEFESFAAGRWRDDTDKSLGALGAPRVCRMRQRLEAATSIVCDSWCRIRLGFTEHVATSIDQVLVVVSGLWIFRG